MMAFQACTILARNYLAHARVLHGSFRRFHPDLTFSALIIDAEPGTVTEAFDVLTLDEIQLPEGEETRMPMLYDVTELATAVKPWFFRELLRRSALDLLYFDPDIEIFRPLDHLAQLARQHCIVLTPHTTKPMTRNDVRPNETDILSAGAYNLGFLGLNAQTSTGFLHWWSERLLREALIDVKNMRFTDQRWIDFAPGYFDTHILKDEACNVAYWNADTRPLRWSGERYEVDGESLCFFHFSGFKPERPHLLSSHQSDNPRTRLSQQPVLARLCREYANKLREAGYDRTRKTPYGHATAPSGLRLTQPMRLAFRQALRDHEENGTSMPPSPFADEKAFVRWLNEPLEPRRAPEITRYFWAILEARPDLRALFPNLLGVDNRRYYEWVLGNGRIEYKIPPELLPPPPPGPLAAEKGGIAQKHRPGVTLVGYLRAEAGTGEAARLMYEAVRAAGEECAALPHGKTRSRQSHPWQNGSSEPADYDTNVLCVNADQLPDFAEHVGPSFFADRYNIGLWFWEAELFPRAMHRAFDFVQEVWVTSKFAAEAIGREAPVPVHVFPLPLNVDAPLAAPVPRAELGLPDSFVFLFSFDFFSVFERKNPAAVVEAFKKAFTPGEGPVLVLKSINGHRRAAELERLHYVRGDRPDILIRDEYLSAPENRSLAASCDCYVSLHRAEGFGLTLAEAMLQEKPVIATRYSGNLEFMTDANSFLCDYRLKPIGNGCEPYPPDAYWAEPNLVHAAQLMRQVFENQAEARHRGEQARRDLIAGHHPKVAGPFIRDRLTEMRRQAPRKLPFSAGLPERPLTGKVRTALERGVHVRSTVPPLLTWILQGPRRAMKKFLRSYDDYQRSLGLSMLDAIRELDSESLQEAARLRQGLHEQEEELRLAQERLQDLQARLAAVEKGIAANIAPHPDHRG